MSYSLSICIPTRNRPQELVKTVKTIQGQIIASRALDRVEILISDNTDEDNLKVDPAAWQDTNIRYVSNEGNIGYARNLNKLIRNARGKYVWFLADDDSILESAVESILQCLENQKLKAINYLTFYSGAVWDGVRDENFYFKNCTQHYFAEGRDFLEKYWLNCIFVSVNIFDREKMISHAEKHNIFNNINDVYQNSLLCISFINAYGHVQIIPKTLVFDSYARKLYTPFNSVSIPVLDYVKLLLQLKNLDVDKACLQKIKKDVDASLLSNGVRFVIRKIETGDTFDYAAEYRKVIGNKELYLSSRAKAGFVYLLFKCNTMVSKPIVKALYRIRRKKNLYEHTRQESISWYEDLKKIKVKVSY